jgi:hypothetical protein
MFILGLRLARNFIIGYFNAQPIDKRPKSYYVIYNLQKLSFGFTR